MRRALGVAAVIVGVFAVVATASSPAPARTTCAAHWETMAHSQDVPVLSSVVAFSRGDVWAVGTTAVKGRPQTALIVHWDGRSFRRFPVPARAGVRRDLNAIAGIGPNDIWAVGSDYGRDNHITRVLILHWNGTRWIRLQVAGLAQGDLSGVVAVSPTDAWAVGSVSGHGWPLVLHWNGRRWHGGYENQLRASVPPWSANEGTGLTDVEAHGPNDVWAIGTWYGVDIYTYGPVVVHWNGRGWHSVAITSEIRSGYGSALTVAPAGDTWALYNDTDDSDRYVGNAFFLSTWNDLSRKLEQRHAQPGAFASDLAAASSQDIWVVGQRWSMDGNTPLGPLVMHYDGHHARSVPTPFAHFRSLSLNAISMVTADEIWAVGDHLIARYAC